MGSLFQEIKRRKVFRVAAVYAIVAWLIIQVAGEILPTFEAPAWVSQTLVVLLVLGLPVALILAWAFDLTPQGIQATASDQGVDTSSQDTGHRLTNIMLGLVLLAVGFLVVDQYVLDDTRRLADTQNGNQATPRIISFSHELPPDVTFPTTNGHLVDFSPVSSQFIFNTVDGVYLRDLNSESPQLIAGANPPLLSPVFSPDGESIVYFDVTEAQLKRLPISGGTAVALSATVFPSGISWTESGVILVGQPSGIISVPENGGVPDLVVPAGEEEDVHGPQLLPGEEWLLFTSTNRSGSRVLFPSF